MTARLLGLALVAALVAALTVQTIRGAAARRPYGMSEFLYRLAVCETGLTWTWDSGSYEGAFGWYWGTWLLDRYPGMPSRAYQATPWQQVRVAYRSVARGRYFGCAANSSWVRAAR